MASHRKRVRLVSLLAAVAALATACGSDGEGELPGDNPSTVPGGGHRYSFGDDTPRSEWPNPCSFIPTSSARQLLGGPATAERGTLTCSYPVGVASVPALSVGVRWVGGAASTKFTYAVGQIAARKVDVPSIRNGDAVRTTAGALTRIDMLVSNVYMRVQVQAVTSKRADVTDASRLAIRAAQIVAAQLR